MGPAAWSTRACAFKRAAGMHAHPSPALHSSCGCPRPAGHLQRPRSNSRESGPIYQSIVPGGQAAAQRRRPWPAPELRRLGPLFKAGPRSARRRPCTRRPSLSSHAQQQRAPSACWHSTAKITSSSTTKPCLADGRRGDDLFAVRAAVTSQLVKMAMCSLWFWESLLRVTPRRARY